MSWDYGGVRAATSREISAIGLPKHLSTYRLAAAEKRMLSIRLDGAPRSPRRRRSKGCATFFQDANDGGEEKQFPPRDAIEQNFSRDA
jgi:hypothetical protein